MVTTSLSLLESLGRAQNRSGTNRFLTQLCPTTFPLYLRLWRGTDGQGILMLYVEIGLWTSCSPLYTAVFVDRTKSFLRGGTDVH